MILDFLLLADAATAAEGKLYIQGGAISRINMPQFPFVVPSIAAVGRFVLEESDDPDQERMIGFEWRRSGQLVVPSIQAPIRAQVPPQRVEGEEVSIIVVAGFNGLLLPEPGIYELAMTLDADVIARRTIPVVLIESVPPANP